MEKLPLFFFLKKQAFRNKPNLDPFFVIDSADHLHTHLCDFVEVWQLQADVPQDFDDSFSHANASVLQ